MVRLEGQAIAAHRIIIATGGRDELPDVPGLAERWGKDVVHCGFCHGYEVRGQRIGVLATGPMAIHQAMMFRLLSPHVTVLAHTAPPTAEQSRDLAARGITIVSGAVAEVLTQHDQLTGVRLEDGTHVDLDAVVVATTVHARADFLAPLGLVLSDFVVNGHVMGTRIETRPQRVHRCAGGLDRREHRRTHGPSRQRRRRRIGGGLRDHRPTRCGPSG